MRGTPPGIGICANSTGIIPAYAGNTGSMACTVGIKVDHPRVCGEHHMPFPQQSGPAGSSPRMRGTLNYPSGDAEAAGIIPAYAGNTSIEHRKRRWNWDHPRVCGEHTPSARSSPLPRDHPRVCGEHRSPVSWRIPPTRIIPAYAGNTRFAQQICCVYRDHPRVCGEHIAFVPAITVVVGSSPRMRGTPRRMGRAIRPEGIIPAYAGNTQSETTSRWRSRDHPRVCGEHDPPVNGSDSFVGSSPRMRGTH